MKSINLNDVDSTFIASGPGSVVVRSNGSVTGTFDSDPGVAVGDGTDVSAPARASSSPWRAARSFGASLTPPPSPPSSRCR